MKKQAGFSLVELVIVIIVVGLLAVAALPRFLNVTDEAKKAQIEGVAGGFATAVLSARAQWEAEGRPTFTNNNNSYNKVNYDGTDFWLTVANSQGNRDGYPVDIASNNDKRPSGLSKETCAVLFEELMQNPPAITSNESSAKGKSNNYKFYAAYDSKNRACEYYQLASANSDNNSTYDVTSGHKFTYTPALGKVEVSL